MSDRKKEQAVERALTEGYEKYYRLAYSYVHNEADALDIVQEAAYKAILKSDSLKEPQYVETWVYRIVINEACSFHRTRRSIEFGHTGLATLCVCFFCQIRLVAFPPPFTFSRLHRYYATTFTETKNGYCLLTKVFPSTISQPCNRLNVFSFLRSDISIMGRI